MSRVQSESFFSVILFSVLWSFPSPLLAGDLALGFDPLPTSNGWTLTLHDAIRSNAYTLIASPDLTPDSWQDTAVIQATNGVTRVTQVAHPLPNSAQFYAIRESSLEDFDGDNLPNRAEFDAGSDPTQSDTDHDLFTDYEEVVLNHTHPGQSQDGIVAIEDTRRILLAKWALIHPTPPAFTNQPGSVADLADLENVLRQLSGVFFTSQK